MSRNRHNGGGRGGNGSVRGPASALTSFLAGLGVEPSALGGPSSSQPESSATAIAALNATEPPTDTSAAAGLAETQDEDLLPVADRKRRKPSEPNDQDDRPGASSSSHRRKIRALSVNSDNLDDFDNHLQAVDAKSAGVKESNTSAPQSLKAVGEFMNCGECENRFTVTAYTKEHPAQASAWLCVNCCYKLNIDPFAKTKKPVKAKTAGRKAERAKVVHYEQRKGATSLGELCIELIGKYIEDVEQLGDIGSVNMDKVCRIISKSRQLTPETAALFFSQDREELVMYDCTRLTNDSYLTLANLCPNLRSLSLHLCGQMTTEAMSVLGQNLLRIRSIELVAPFLVRKEGWSDFFKAAGKQLECVLITQSPRVDTETIQTLVESCPNLIEVRLAEIGQLNDEGLQQIGKLQKLRHLDLSSPGSSLTDDAIVQLLKSVGKNLDSLNLSDNSNLTDAILPAIVEHCATLKELRLRNVVQLTDDGVASFFDSLATRGKSGFEVIDLEKGYALKGKALQSLISHSGGSVEKLSLLGWREVETTALTALSKCTVLQDLDVGWCRGVTDFCIKDVLDSCNEIQVIRVWGCNQLSDAVPRKKGVKVIGIETHSI